MRVLHVVPTYLPATRYGGPIYSVHELCRSLCKESLEVHVATTNVDGKEDSQVPLREPVNVDGVRVWYFPCPMLRRIYWSPGMARFFAARLESFDLVHLHSVFLWPTNRAARIAKASGVPYILAPRGMLDANLIRRKSRWKKTAWLKFVEERTLAGAARLHVTSIIEYQEALHLGMPLPPRLLIPNGVRAPLPSCSSEERIQTGKTILFLGRINWKKGLDRLIPVLSALSESELIIAGNDEEKLTPKLRKLARECGVEERVHFLGEVRGRQKEELFRSARVFVLPSYGENFGNAVLEALQYGCPVVLTKEVGLAEEVRSSGAGLVVDGDQRSLASALHRLMDDPQAGLQMGMNGRRLIEQRFTWDRIAKSMIDAYQELIGNIPAAREKEICQSVPDRPA